MTLEKAFAVHAEPAVIWRELTRELAQAPPGSHTVERSVEGQELAVRVELQKGVEAVITYLLIPREEYVEVVARMEPHGFRYALMRAFTLGRYDIGYQLALAEGLSNLKMAAEAAASEGAKEQPPGR
jgi:hypothetical protein